MTKVKTSLVAELSEIDLINKLAVLIVDWVHNVRFTVEKDTDRDLSDNDLSAHLKIYKYYLPPREEKPTPPINQRSQSGQVRPNIEPQLPAVIIRPIDGVSNQEDGLDYQEFSIDIILLVKEYSLMNRYEFLLLAKKIVIDNLRMLPSGILANSYTLQKNIIWKHYDDTQSPNGGLAISTTWRCAAPQFGAIDLTQTL